MTAWDTYEDEHCTPVVTIGKNCNFGNFLHLTCINKIEMLAGRCETITDNRHDTAEEIINDKAPIKRKLYTKDPTIIENDIWIGDKATILPGVTIGKGSIIGANSVVTKSIPQYSMASGNPAEIIKTIIK